MLQKKQIRPFQDDCGIVKLMQTYCVQPAEQDGPNLQSFGQGV